MLCDITRNLSCSRCGRIVSHIGVKAECVHVSAGLGDRIAAGLTAVGVTKERVSAIVGGDCGCEQRQQALNELGYKLGIGVTTEPHSG
jgi:hypothetical protein